MKEYKEYQDKLKEVEQEEGNGKSAVEQHVPTAFLFVCAAISAGATYYLNEAGMKHSPFYAKTIGADNAALLVTVILEGSFLALTIWGHQLLKSQPQREWGKIAILALKVILSLNVITAFVLLSGQSSRLMPAVELYTQYGAPASVAAAIWFWGFIVSNRRRTIMRNRMLDDAARNAEIWARQHAADQQRYRDTYQTISGSPEMQTLRDEVALRQAIEQIAKESGITVDEARQIFERAQNRHKLPTANPATLPDPAQNGGPWPKYFNAPKP